MPTCIQQLRGRPSTARTADFLAAAAALVQSSGSLTLSALEETDSAAAVGGAESSPGPSFLDFLSQSVPHPTTEFFGWTIFGEPLNPADLQSKAAWNGAFGLTENPGVGERRIFQALSGRATVTATQLDEHLCYEMRRKGKFLRAMGRRKGNDSRCHLNPLVPEDEAGVEAIDFLEPNGVRMNCNLIDALDVLEESVRSRIGRPDEVEWEALESDIRNEVFASQNFTSVAFVNGDCFLHQQLMDSGRIVYLCQSQPQRSRIYNITGSFNLEKSPNIELHNVVLLPPTFRPESMAAVLQVPLYHQQPDNEILFFSSSQIPRIVRGQLASVIQIHHKLGDVVEITRDRSGTEWVLWHYVPKQSNAAATHS